MTGCSSSILSGWTGAPSKSPGGSGCTGLLSISHETIYMRVWDDKDAGGELWRHMRQATKLRRKRY